VAESQLLTATAAAAAAAHCLKQGDVEASLNFDFNYIFLSHPRNREQVTFVNNTS
jgi:hypothetical protein